jgi:hypothetical protein
MCKVCRVMCKGLCRGKTQAGRGLCKVCRGTRTHYARECAYGVGDMVLNFTRTHVSKSLAHLAQANRYAEFALHRPLHNALHTPAQINHQGHLDR